MATKSMFGIHLREARQSTCRECCDTGLVPTGAKLPRDGADLVARARQCYLPCLCPAGEEAAKLLDSLDRPLLTRDELAEQGKWPREVTA